MRLINIFLRGKLADEFGEKFNFAVSTPNSALRALCSQVRGFERRFRDGKYRILRKRGVVEAPVLSTGDSRFQLTERDSLIIVPDVAGGAAGAFILFTFAFSYALGKIFTPELQAPDYPAVPPSEPSFLFDGPTNISAQGICVPLVYGRIRAGSIVVSENISSILVPPAATVGGEVFGIGKSRPDTQRIIDVISEGEIGGLVAGANSIFMNDTPVIGSTETYESTAISVVVAFGDYFAYVLPAGQSANYTEDQVITVSGFVNSENNGIKTVYRIQGNQVVVWGVLVAESAGPAVTITRQVNTNFKSVNWWERVGTSDQLHVPGFSQTEDVTAVGVEVAAGTPVIRTVTGADLDGLLVTLSFPQGLYRIPDWGGLEAMWVRITIEVKPSGGSYEKLIDSPLHGQTQTSFKLDYRVELPAGVSSWDVRVSKYIWVPQEAQVWHDTVNWASYTTIIDAKLSYPDTALIALTFNAKDFGGSVPARGYEVDGLKIKIPSNYNPITRIYTGIWDGTFQTAWTNNPAWVLYDLLTNVRYGLGKYIDAAQIDKWELYSIAQFSDERVTNGFGYVSNDIEVLAGNIYELPNGHEQLYEIGEIILVQGFTETTNDGLKTVVDFSGNQIEVSETLIVEAPGDQVIISHTEPRYVFNGVFGKRESAYKNLTALVSNFRGMLYWGADGSVGFSQDRPDKTPIKLVSPANVVDGLFTYSGAQFSEQHSVALVSWNDPENNYRKAVEVVEDPEQIARFGWKPVDVTAFGCTSRGQAARYGKYRLVTERYESERVSYSASFDHADLRPGDVISIADPAYAGVRFGGRIVTPALDEIEIDAGIDLEPATSYEISVILPDGTIETRGVTNSSGPDQTVITLDSILPDIPVVGSLWTVSTLNVLPREFTVVSIRETRKNTFEIGAIFRMPNKFEAIENDLFIEDNSYSVFDPDPGSIPEVTGVTVTEYTYIDGGAILAGARISWDTPTDPVEAGRVAFYEVQYLHPDQDSFILAATTSDLSADLLNIQAGVYKIRVRGLSALGATGPWASIEYNMLGAKAPPDDVENFGIQVAGATALLTWTEVSNIDVSHYEIRYTGATTGATWESSVVAASKATGNQISLPAKVGTFLIKAVDVFGIKSVNAALVVSTIAGLLGYNVIETFTEHPTFPGEKIDVFVFDDLLQLDDGLVMADWTTLAEVEALAGLDVVPEGTYLFDANPFDLGAVFSSRVTADFLAEGWNKLTLMEAADGWTVRLELRTTDDDPGGSPTWSDWREFIVGDYTARGFEFRLKLFSTADNVTPRVSALSVTVDMPDRVVGEFDITCPVAGLQVDYTPAFKARPALAVDSQDLDTGDYKTISGQDETGFFVQFFNSGDTPVERTFDYLAKGYGAES